ncbi:MAG: sigma-70 family RNA polymerase sigma factor [Actinomycetota bacterium]
MADAMRFADVAGEQATVGGFDDAYPRLYQQAYRVAFRLLGSREDAADAAQEACARAYARWAAVARHPSPEAWVSRVASNLALDVWRRRATAQRKAQHVTVTTDGLDGDRVDLHRALDALPRRQRQVVLLRYVADLSEAAVAAALRCSVGNVKSNASRGLAALRVAMQVDG